MDFSAVCRTCLGTNDLNPVFVAGADHTRHAMAVFIATGIKVELNDGLPQQICSSCTNYINSSLNFRQKCKDAENQLLQYISNISNTTTTLQTNNETVIKIEFDIVQTDIVKTEIKDEIDDITEETEANVKCEDAVQVFAEGTDTDARCEDYEAEDTQISNSTERDEESDVSEKLLRVKKTKNPKDYKKGTGPRFSGPMPLSGAERTRRYREKLKQDPEKVESMRKKNLERIKSTKKKIAQLTTEEAAIRRENWKEYKRSSRMKKKGNIPTEIVRDGCRTEPQLWYRVTCTICGKDLAARSLRAHNAAQHSAYTVKPALRCGYCGVDQESKEDLAAHMDTCPRKMRKLEHNLSGREMVSCEVCHKTMQRSSLRAHHAVKHKGLGPVCEHCGRRFGNKLRLSEHLRAKHGHAKLQCGHCDFKSASSAALQNHERRHRGEKPFVCEECGKKFHAAHLLAQHKLSHRTDKNVKCGQCDAVFKSQNALHAHRVSRHDARRHRCMLCTRVYNCRHYAVKHLRNYHGFKGTVPPLQIEPAPT